MTQSQSHLILNISPWSLGRHVVDGRIAGEGSLFNLFIRDCDTGAQAASIKDKRGRAKTTKRVTEK